MVVAVTVTHRVTRAVVVETVTVSRREGHGVAHGMATVTMLRMSRVRRRGRRVWCVMQTDAL